VPYSYGYVPYSYSVYNTYYGYDPYGYYGSFYPYSYSNYYGYDPYSYSNYYGYDPYAYSPYYGYNSGFGWKQLLLSVVLNNILSSLYGGNGYDDYAAYDPYYYNSPYGYSQYESYYYSSGYSYNPGYYDPYAYDSGYYNPPLYSYYGSPYGYSYLPSGYYDTAYNDPYNELPIGCMLTTYSGGSIADVIRQAVSYGYDRGYMDGSSDLYARVGDSYYQNPYDYPEPLFRDESTSCGRYNEYLSQGYALGYQDALHGRNQYDPYNNGNTDLVGLVLNNVVNGSAIF
jgi:hypothetical protein